MRCDIEKLAESKCHLPPWSATARQPKEQRKKMNERERRWASNVSWNPSWPKKGSQKKKDWQTSRELGRPCCFSGSLLLTKAGWLEIAIVWHLAPAGPGCCEPAVKCDARCRAFALQLLLLFGCGGIRAGTRGSTAHPKESRCHIPEWNAFWHCSASPWFE